MKTIARETSIIFEEKKSKFVGHAMPVATKQEAEDYIAAVRAKYSDATHNCTAYSVVENGQEYYKVDDDGEPSGTAGKPIGDIIKYMDVQNVVVVVTRYFGGIKLGAGGLVRAYAKAAKLALQEAEIIEYVKRELYMIEFGYDKIGEIDNLLSKYKIEPLDKGFNEKITYKVMLDDTTLAELSGINNIFVFSLV